MLIRPWDEKEWFPFRREGSIEDKVAQRQFLTTRCYRYIIADESDEVQGASWRVEKGNVG